MLDTVRALNVLLDLNKAMDAHGVNFWLDGGTLLGAYRENSFMDSDFDIDIGMYGEDDKKLPLIRESLRELGFGNFHLKEHPCGEGKQLSFIKDGIPGDIFVYYKYQGKRWRLMFDIDPCMTVRFIPCVYPVELFTNLATIDFMDYGVLFNMPNPTDKYLELQYGDWKTDKPKEAFSWQRDYKSMDMNFPIYDKPEGKRRWILSERLPNVDADGSFFEPLLKEGYKIYPIHVDKDMNVIDGHKRLAAYKKLKIPMVECICTNQQ